MRTVIQIVKEQQKYDNILFYKKNIFNTNYQRAILLSVTGTFLDIFSKTKQILSKELTTLIKSDVMKLITEVFQVLI
ncbi:MAG: hypothetical protein GY795_32630 [Desulfobacterales bacterium]|nr:hypothetical protein [Desulfobacterales bacterium]